MTTATIIIVVDDVFIMSVIIEVILEIDNQCLKILPQTDFPIRIEIIKKLEKDEK